MSKGCEAKEASSNRLLCPIICPKPKESSFTFKKDKEKQQICTWKMSEMISGLLQLLAINSSWPID